jgi:hypothetical protein
MNKGHLVAYRLDDEELERMNKLSAEFGSKSDVIRIATALLEALKNVPDPLVQEALHRIVLQREEIKGKKANISEQRAKSKQQRAEIITRVKKMQNYDWLINLINTHEGKYAE